MAYGYGSVYQRASDGRWVAAVTLPAQRGEKRRRKTFTATSRSEVEAALAAYRAANPERVVVGKLNNELRREAPGHHTDSQWWRLVRERESICEYCGVKCVIEGAGPAHRILWRDHKTPLVRGGSDDISNIAVSCRTCNMSKGAMTAEEFHAWKDRRAAG